MKNISLADLEERLRYYEESPYVDGYNAIVAQLDKWNEELTENPISLKSTDDSDMKAFEKAHKFLTSIDTLYEKLAYLRSKMNPDQQAAVDEIKNKKLQKAGSQVAI